MNPKIAKPLAFLANGAILVGAICGIAMNFYHHEPVAGVCCIVLALAAVPTFISNHKYLKS